MTLRYHIVAIIALASTVPIGQAQVTDYWNRAAWESAAGNWSTIDFTGWPQLTHITDQYSHLGVHFTGGQPGLPASYDFIQQGFAAFPNDGWGLSNTWANLTIHAQIVVEFDALQTHFAFDGPGGLRLLLYYQNQLIHTSIEYVYFGGVISTQPFDKVVIRREITDSSVNVDNLYFSTPIPGPAAFGLLGLAAIIIPRRRRT